MKHDILSLIPQDAPAGGVLALGNFDGVHRGHRAVLASAVERARHFEVPARVLTFEPHPRAVFWSDHTPFRLTPPKVKEQLLKEAGIADVVVLPFTLNLAEISAIDFVEQILHHRLAVRHIVAGYDFTFGYKRGGDMAQLATWLSPYGIGVTEITPQGEGEIFSSTRIRELLRDGACRQASQILGRDWSIEGIVEHGSGRGRTIGVPTANIALGDYLRPAYGVYAIEAKRGNLVVDGVANIGVRPTVDGRNEKLEAHLFDFDQDMYGQNWEFALKHFIRPERKFDDFMLLKKQIAEDIVAAKQALAEKVRMCTGKM